MVMNEPVGKRAVVIGGSVAGTLAARVLSEFYREVVVVDRDEVLGVDKPRRGTPHTWHAHGLHARGYFILEELFPNLLDDLRDSGVPVGDLARMKWYFNGKQVMPADSGLPSITALRPVLEHHLRLRTAALPNVTYRERTDVHGLLATREGKRIIGVRVQARDGSPEERLGADLVVDASGRGTRTPVWLEELGFERPAEERVKVGLAYTTRMFRKRPEMFGGWQSINPVASPAHPRGAFFGQVNEDECILSLTGLLGDHPPTDARGYLDYVKSLPAKEIYEAVKDAQPLIEPVTFKFPASLRRRYERLKRFPERLFVLGDAFCSFNPVYGQGMTVASMEAIALREHLRRRSEPDSRRFLREIGKVVNDPWDISTSGDLDFPGVEGKRTLKVKMGNAYMAKVQYAATIDPEITAAFMRVAGLVDPPTALMKPSVVRKVLRANRRRPVAGATVTELPRSGSESRAA
ncbi:FAD-binding monooxygenase [Amycolatopsis sp. WAC 01376]|nr:FAD-binding monooxygenase [Amycolatopsis sp. WAC 01376]